MYFAASAVETFLAGVPTTSANSHSQSICTRPLGITTSSLAPTTTLGDLRNRYGLSGRVSPAKRSHRPGAELTDAGPRPPAALGVPAAAGPAPAGPASAWPPFDARPLVGDALVAPCADAPEPEPAAGAP